MKNQVFPEWAGLQPGESGIDVECVSLCEAMNRFPGVRTTESCCGHGADEFRIYFKVSNLEMLPPVLYYFDGCHCGYFGWSVVVKTDCGMSPVYFVAKGPSGERAYREANCIAELMTKYLESKK